MQEFKVQTRFTIKELTISVITMILVGLLMYFSCTLNDMNINYELLTFVIGYYAIVCICILIYIFISMGDNKIYLSNFIIEKEFIELVYKKQGQIVSIDTIKKEEIKSLKINHISNSNDYKILVKITKHDDKEIIIDNKLIMLNIVDCLTIHYFLEFLLENKDSIPNFSITTDIKDKKEKKYWETLYETGKKNLIQRTDIMQINKFPKIYYKSIYIILIIIAISVLFWLYKFYADRKKKEFKYG